MNIWEIATNYYQYFLRGTRTTILISLLTVFCGSILGCLFAFMRLSKFKPLEKFASIYITVIRGTPMLVQLYIVYYQLDFISYPTGTLFGVDLERALPCIIALSINSSAYVAEIIRAGIQAVDKGQMEGARSCGMTNAQAMRYVVIPQAVKNILPAIGNEFVTMVKETSIIQYLGIGDLMYNNGINLAKGDFDIVIAGMASTEERLKSVDFSDPYFKQQQAILIRAEDDALYNKPEDLSGHKVGVQNGTIQVPIANELVGEENVVGLVKAQDLIMELKSGKLDVVYIDYTAALAFAAANDDLTVKDIGIESDSEGQCIGVQKGNEDFVAYLNEKIAEMQEQGLVDQYVAEAQTLAGIE